MMRTIKSVLTFFVAVVFVCSCTQDDDVSFALQEVSAPTNLDAIFDIAQDDSGQVSVTPTGVGASVFEVYFGDVENETPTEVNPGETVTHTYGEGEFTLRIVAIGATGLKSELSRIITISFEPPSDLEVVISVSETNPFEITVAPSATNATVFDIFFGDEVDEMPTTIMSGETASHIYAEAGDYDVRVVARGAGSATVESTETITIAGAADPIALPITFDIPTVNYAFGTFNGASYEVVDNPDLSGTNPEASKVGAITNSGNQFEGGAFNLGTPVDFSSANKTITMKFWSMTPTPILLKFEGGVNGERENEVVANHGGTGWEDISFNFATDATKSFIDGSQGVGEPFVPEGQYATMVIFIDGPGTLAGTFYLDNIEQPVQMSMPLELPISFDNSDVMYAFGTFNGASYDIVDNPDPTGANPEVSKVGAITNSGNQFEGGAFVLDTPVDFSGDNKTINMKFWSMTPTPLLLKFEGGVNGERENEVVANHTGTGWEELNFNFATDATKSFIDGSQGVGEPFVPTGQYTTLVLFVDGPGNTAGTFYMDDITQLAPTMGNANARIAGNWIMANEAGSLGVGPAPGDISWFAIDAQGLMDRACYFDDVYTFNADGSFLNDLGSDTWLEGWQSGAADACGTPVAPHDGSAAATYVFDDTAGTITINGAGAYIGLPKANNQGELPNVAVPASIVYNVTLSDNDNTMNIVIESGTGSGVYWQYKLVRDVPPAAPAIAGTWIMANEAGSLGVGPAPGDTSWFAIDAQGLIDRACYFDDTYEFGADGSFVNNLGSDTWLEGWQSGAADACGSPVTPHNGAAATYVFDDTAGTVTINGAGAYLGLPKANNQGELPNVAVPDNIVYNVTLSDNNTTMNVIIETGTGSGVYWQYKLVKQ